ncbi:MAG: DEAD/DEAH box helicase family protein [Iphinoe sp. HA4291-MV1]|jgi:superfamily II DNA or RNA helicase|nr:DEAD/DEAH box helicase family protein [Iphinoe sp. HA4291-MV1]
MFPRLFPYQLKTVNQVYDHIRAGKRRVLLVAPTGSGKTNMGAYMAKDAVAKRRQAVFVVHRDTLVDQAIETFKRWGLSCGAIAGGRSENRAADVQVCSFQTLSGNRDTSWLKPGLVIADECLSRDSLINTLDGTFRIDDPSIVGKLALSYNENLHIWEYKRIKHQIFKGYKQTLIIKTEKYQIRCTGNHLIRTTQGWKRADDLKMRDKILSPCVNVDAEKLLHRRYPCRTSHLNQSLTILPSGNFLKDTPQYPLFHLKLDKEESKQERIKNSSLQEVIDVEAASVEPVYDLTIANNHNFVANGLLVHNCHYTSFTDIILQWFPKNHYDPYEIPYIGLTATPFRLKKRESLGEIFHALALAPSYAELIAMGNLVKPVYYEVPNSTAGDMIADASYMIESWRAIAQNSPTIAFTQSIHFAEVLAQAFNDSGIGAAPITEKTSRTQRDKRYKAFEREEIKVLVSCTAIAEGFDSPKARVAILARNTQSRALFVQATGRVMRAYTYPDGTPKTDCIILDQMGVVKRFGFIEDIVINESVFNIDDSDPGNIPTKTCPVCKRILPLSAKRCDRCGYEFESAAKELSLPEGKMRRVFRDNVERTHYATYVRMLQKAFSKKLPLSWADRSFLEKFNYFPPSDWRRNAIIRNADETTKAEFKEYLQAIAAEERRNPNWITRQLSLELGI